MAASIPQLQFYSDNYPLYTVTDDFCEHLQPVAAATSSNAAGAGALWGEETLVPLFHEFGLDQTSSYSHPQHQQEVVALPHQHELDNIGGGGGGGDIISTAGCQNLCLGYPNPPPDNHFYEFGDQHDLGFGFGLLPHIKPAYHPLPTDNWEIQSNNQVPATDQDDSNNMKVGRYSEEVRKERILRYLKKRNQRNFNKTIKYACRKTLADRRIRVRGRFARNNEACDQQLNPTKNNDDISESTQLLYNHHDLGAQMKKDEEEWLQEITSLIYLPYITR